MEIKKGLVGVYADETIISNVFPEERSLYYYGYSVSELAEKCDFEEVAYLLLYGKLPNKEELSVFIEKEKKYRHLSDDLLKVIACFPNHAHPMDTLRTAVSFLGLEDERIWDNSQEVNLDKAISLLAKIPIIIALTYRHQKGLGYKESDDTLSLSDNFFQLCFSKIPSSEVIKAFNVSLILYAEHGFNCSTFTARVITSSQADLYGAVTGAIAALKGPLHGGANEQVMHTMKEIGSPENAEKWLMDKLANKEKVMGFGHRVYYKGDSRVPVMKKYMEILSESKGELNWKKIYHVLEKIMVGEKNIFPNLDFPAGPAYYLMGFDIDMFTPIFVMARITGWSAHIMEQTNANRIVRPLCAYIGEKPRGVIPLTER